MIKYSFETPIEMLGDSLEYNDYEYCLVHLLPVYPAYLEFYTRQIQNRPMYLDNSAYELGSSFDPNEFRKWCEKFAEINTNNLYYFIPDYPGNPEKSVESVKNFQRIPGANSIGVIHGNNQKEFVESFLAIKDLVDMVAIPMIPSTYEGKSLTLLERTFERIELVRTLWNLDTTVKIHLLGCLLPQEFRSYNGEVYSADTSNPIVHGYEGIAYRSFGLDSKSNLKLHEIIDHPVKNKELILSNLQEFRRING